MSNFVHLVCGSGQGFIAMLGKHGCVILLTLQPPQAVHLGHDGPAFHPHGGSRNQSLGLALLVWSVCDQQQLAPFA